MRKCKIILSMALVLMLAWLNVFSAGLVPAAVPVLSAAAAEADLWLVPGAGARQTVAIHNPTSALLRDMPVLVRLNGADIPEKDGVSFYAGTERLASELASWNAGGVSTYWVKVPVLAAETDTVITVYYSGRADSDAAPASAVWSDQYGLVQHFSESAAAASQDSTGNGTLTRTGSLAFKRDAVGGAATFTGKEKITYSNQVIGANAAVFSASAVVSFTSMAGSGGYYGIVCRDRNGAQPGDTFMLTLSNSNVNSSVYPNGEVAKRVNVQKGVTAGTAYLLTMTYDGAELKLYINGELAGAKPAENAVLLDSGLSPFTIGAYSDTDLKSGLKGDLYDVFFKTEVISPEEETFRYANYLGDAVTAGPLETQEVSSGPLGPGTHYLYQAITGDTYCDANGDDGRNTNYGNAAVVMQKRTKPSDAPDFQSSANRRAFVKLDLTEIAAVAPTRIEAVTFDFYQNGSGGKTDSMQAKIVDIDPNSWNESEVVWTTMPATYGLPAAAVQTIAKREKSYQSFDITNYIKEKIAEGKTEISFSLDNEPASEWGLSWNSREAAENKPRLTVKVKEPAAPVLSAAVNGTAAVLTAQLEQNPDEKTQAAFYRAQEIPLTAENTAVYTGETSELLPDALNPYGAGQGEVFGGETQTTVGNGKTPYQIYEITLSGEARNQPRIDVTWTGNTAGHQREVTAYYYSHTADRWVRTDCGSSEKSFSLRLNIPSAEALDQDGKARILIWRGLNEAIEGRSSYAPGLGQYDFNIMWSTDTQGYTVKTNGMQHVRKQFEWIADNFDAMNSKLFLHTGDMVENYDIASQWEAMSGLYRDTIEKAKIPYAFTVGNHDVNRYDASKNIFQNYFPVSRLRQNNPYFGESYDDMTYYYLMEESGAKLMFVGLGIPITQGAVDWVNSALARHPDYTAVLLPHIYLLADGSIDNTGRYGAEVTVPQLRTIIEQNSNVRLVLCGHWDGASTNLEYFGGRPVWAMMHDYQGFTDGGYGYFRFLKFDIENNLIYTHTYSASDNGTAVYTDKQPAQSGLYQKHRDEFAIHFDFGVSAERVISTESLRLYVPGLAGEQIGTAQTVTGPGSASVVWDNLEEGSAYSWYAVLTDEAGTETITEIQTFTVPQILLGDISYAEGRITVPYSAVGIADGTPLSIMAFAVEEGEGAETVWNGHKVAYQDIFAYSSADRSLSFRMPEQTGEGVAGLDTAKRLVIKLGGEFTNTAAKVFALPVSADPEIQRISVTGDRVIIRLSRPLEGTEVLYAAAYSAGGILTEIGQASGETGPAQDGAYEIEITASGDAARIKAMWWMDSDTQQPVCGSKSVEKLNGQWPGE